jgi:uncharacterized membrane protein YcaP (DUF421 family)/predicted RNA-binding Zn-ribbon protein involved in translation (DUF1610 family)
MDQAITVLDWKRMFFGDEPPLYLLEILVRTLIIYGYTLGLLRWLGSRTIGQLSTVEFLLVIALGSAVGDAMFYPDVPLVHALLVVTIVVLANKGLDILIARFKTAERIIDGVPEEAIRAGVFCTDFLKSTSLGRSEIFQQLRERGVEHMGQVAHGYIEADGALTVFLAKQPRPGLPIVPPWELSEPERIDATTSLAKAAQLSCLHCGTLVEVSGKASAGACPHCGHSHWTWAQSETKFAVAGDAEAR